MYLHIHLCNFLSVWTVRVYKRLEETVKNLLIASTKLFIWRIGIMARNAFLLSQPLLLQKNFPVMLFMRAIPINVASEFEIKYPLCGKSGSFAPSHLRSVTEPLRESIPDPFKPSYQKRFRKYLG